MSKRPQVGKSESRKKNPNFIKIRVANKAELPLTVTLAWKHLFWHVYEEIQTSKTGEWISHCLVCRGQDCINEDKSGIKKKGTEKKDSYRNRLVKTQMQESVGQIQRVVLT